MRGGRKGQVTPGHEDPSGAFASSLPGSEVIDKIAINRTSSGGRPVCCMSDSAWLIKRIASVLCASASVVLVNVFDVRRESRWAAAACVLAWKSIGDDRNMAHHSIAIGERLSDELAGQNSGQITLISLSQW